MEEMDQIRFRKEKLENLKNMGVNPYPHNFDPSGSVKTYLENYQEGQKVSIAGRIMALRVHGKTIFADLRDGTGKIQLYLRKNDLGESGFKQIELLDIGDWLGVEGALFKTHAGEITIQVVSCKVLTKSIRPLPEKWHGLSNVETRYRKRYLDLIANPEVKDIFIKRSMIIRYMREYLEKQGFMEVETPMMQPIAGGANAKPFVTHHNTLGIDLFLRIAPELYLKRLLVGGFEKVFEINRNFRNEGISRFHNPEFTMMECYAAYWDYEKMMSLTENMVAFIADNVMGTTQLVDEQGVVVSVTAPWKRLTMKEAVIQVTGIDFYQIDNPQAAASKIGVEVHKNATCGEILNEVFEQKVQETLIQPTFITDYPLELCPLTKPKRDGSCWAERFELFVRGQELANAYSELNDPILQRENFVAQAGKNAEKLDEDFLEAIDYGMPPAGGLGIGVDRLVMLLTGVSSIRDIIFFPQLRPVSHSE